MKTLLSNPLIVLISLLTLISVFIIGVLVGVSFFTEQTPSPSIAVPQPSAVSPVNPVLSPRPIDPGIGSGSTGNDGCVIGGCSGQLCTDGSPDSPAMSTCEWREEYACYPKFGVCERQKDGACGWTQTPELDQCLQVAHGTIYYDDPSLTR